MDAKSRETRTTILDGTTKGIRSPMTPDSLFRDGPFKEPGSGKGRTPDPPATPKAAQLRSVHQGAAELRRGAPILLGSVRPLAVLAAETASQAGLAAFTELTGSVGDLVMTSARAADLAGRPRLAADTLVAMRPRSGHWSPAMLLAFADPTAPPAGSPATDFAASPQDADAAIALAKLGRLLPAVLVAPADPQRRDFPRPPLVDAAHVRAYPEAAAIGLHKVAEASVPLEHAADSRVVAFRAVGADIEHLAILVGRPETADAPLVRVHSACFTGDLLGSLRCDCGPQLRSAVRRMAQEGSGALLYLSQEGRGIGLVNKLRAYALQDRGLDTLDANRALGWGADERNFLVAAIMLERLGISRVRLLTNNPDKLAALAACGVEVVAHERHVIEPNGVNDRYLATKAKRFGHLLG